MILQELNLIGFGKFENKKVKLDHGINIIYGENESGKSTIHSFIDGMFYGFLRPNVRSALYVDEHKKYDPWHSNRYGGVLSFQYKGENYRIEREFKKGKESTRVLEEATGRDITKSIDTGRGRILQPGIHFFGFNTRVYSNTISIKQLESKTDHKLADEVREKLINLGTALDDEISIDKAISDLQSSMDEIGTERAHTRLYARNIKKIKDLEDEKKKIQLEKENYELYLDEKTKLLQDLFIEEERHRVLIEKLSKVDLIKKKTALEEARTLSREIISIKSDIMEPSPYEDSIQIDYNQYEEIEEEKNKILHDKKDSNLQLLKKDYKSGKDEGKKSGILSFLAISGIIIALTMKQFLLGGLLILILVYFMMKLIKLKKSMKKLSLEIEKMEEKENKKKTQIQNMERLQEGLLSKYDVTTKSEFKDLVTKIHMKEFSREKAIREIEAKKNLLKRILGSNTIESLILELEKFNGDINENIDEDKLKYSIEKCREKILDIRLELNKVEANINILEKEVSRLVEVEEDLSRKKIYKQELDSKIKSLELAIHTMEELSKDIHSQFVPTINKKIGKTIDKITNGKYNRVRISEELEISVEDPMTKEIISINSLSSGTMDQLYFALRFGIVNSIVENRLPLILDDCFIQYDDNRLKNIIKFLSDIGKERQVILFTCHNREQMVLEEMGINFNLLSLT